MGATIVMTAMLVRIVMKMTLKQEIKMRRILSPDALDELHEWLCEQQAINTQGTYDEFLDDVYVGFRKKINELSTPVKE